MITFNYINLWKQLMYFIALTLFLILFIPYYGYYNLVFYFFLVITSLIAYIFLDNKIYVDNVFLIFYLFFLLWFIYGLLSFIWSIDKERNLEYSLATLFYLTIFFFTSQYANSSEKFSRIRFFLTLVTILLISLSFWEMITWNHLPTSRLTKKGIVTFRATAVFANENDLAAALLIYFPIALYYLKKYSSIWIKTLMSLIIFSSLIIVVINGARLAILFSFPFFFLYLIFFTGKKTKLIFLSILLLFLLMFSFFLTEYLTLFIDYLDLELNSLKTEQDSIFMRSIQIRIELIRKAIDFCVKSYLLGVGNGNYEAHMIYNNRVDAGGSFNPHNLFFELLANNGIIIFFYFIAILVYCALKFIRFFTVNQGILGLHYILLLLTFIVSTSLPSSVSHYYIFWFYLSYIFLGVREIKYENEKTITDYKF